MTQVSLYNLLKYYQLDYLDYIHVDNLINKIHHRDKSNLIVYENPETKRNNIISIIINANLKFHYLIILFA